MTASAGAPGEARERLRVAIFSDVHGNLPALTAVLRDMHALGFGERYCLGDLVDYGPFPDEVVERVLGDDIPTVMGNHDAAVAFDRPELGGGYRDAAERLRKEQALAWTRARVRPATMAALRELPHELRLEVGGKRILLVHASPRSITEYVTADLPRAALREIAAAARADVLVCGHTHLPGIELLDDVLLVNVGSVGNPKDGDPRACYAILEERDGRVTARVRRVAYDIASVTDAIHRNGLPAAFATQLETGGAVPAATAERPGDAPDGARR